MTHPLRYEDFKEGDKIPAKTFAVSQQHINQYAEASGDFNPLHIDEEFAQKTIYKGTIAHGFMILAFVSETMICLNAERWLNGGEMEIKFISPVRPNDQISIQGTVTEKNEHLRSVEIELNVTNQRDETIVAGKTKLNF